jgi:hypothetical protein
MLCFLILQASVLTTLKDLSCGLLGWSQYSLLTAPRYLINPRFHLETPLVSGLFYIAPGLGFLAGTICGGKFADITVKRRIRARGYRLPQDRLNSGLVAFFFILPMGSLVYGWGLQEEVGGLALPIISIFVAGFGLMAAFSSVNTYCAGKLTPLYSLHIFSITETARVSMLSGYFAKSLQEVLPERRTDVMAGKYVVQYIFGAAGSAGILPLINNIGVGSASTISKKYHMLNVFATFAHIMHRLNYGCSGRGAGTSHCKIWHSNAELG